MNHVLLDKTYGLRTRDRVSSILEIQRVLSMPIALAKAFGSFSHVLAFSMKKGWQVKIVMKKMQINQLNKTLITFCLKAKILIFAAHSSLAQLVRASDC